MISNLKQALKHKEIKEGLFTLSPILVSISFSILFFSLNKQGLIALLGLNVGVATLSLAYSIYINWDKAYLNQKELEAKTTIQHLCMKFDRSYKGLPEQILSNLIGRVSSGDIIFTGLTQAREVYEQLSSETLLLKALRKKGKASQGHTTEDDRIEDLALLIIDQTIAFIKDSNKLVNFDSREYYDYNRKRLIEQIIHNANEIVNDAMELFQACGLNENEHFMKRSQILKLNKEIRSLS